MSESQEFVGDSAPPTSNGVSDGEPHPRDASPPSQVGTPSASRGPGRPPKDDPVVTPEILQKIAELHLMGRRIREIAREVGVSHETVRYHLEHTVRPWLAANVVRKRDDILGEIDLMRRLIWREMLAELNDDGERLVQLRETTVDDLSSDSPVRRKVTERVTRRRRREDVLPWVRALVGCMELEAKLTGLSSPKEAAPDRHELRWAGVEPEKIQNEMVRLLATRIKELQEQKASTTQMD